jgi:hypothetical protein
MAWAEPAAQHRNSERSAISHEERDNPPSSEIARLADRHASEVGANAEHDQPLWFLDTIVVWLWVTQGLPVDVTRLVNLVLRAMAYEHGFAAPLDDRVLALRNAPQLYLDLRQRQHVRGGGHRPQELGHGGFGHGGGEDAHGSYHEVRERTVR